MLRRIFLLLGIAGILLAALIFIVPLALPAGTIKGQIEKLIADNTGWTIRFGGDVTMALVPSVRLVAEGIEVSPPNHKPILIAKEARFAVGLKALFSGAVDIEEVYLGAPELTVELDGSGNPVWLETETAPAGSAAPSASPSGSDSSGGLVKALVDTLRVQRLAVENATVRFGKSGETATEISKIDLAAALPDPQGALVIDVSARFGGDDIGISSELPAFKSLLAARKGPLKVEAVYKTARLKGNGTLDLAGDTAFSGAVEADVSDLSQIAGKDTLAPGALKVTGGIIAGKETVRLSFPEGQFLDTAFTVDLTVVLAGERPLVTGAVTLGLLDIDAALPPSTPAPSSAPTAQTGGGSAGTPDLSAFRAADADITFTANSIRSAGQKIDALRGRAVLRNGVAELTIDNVTTAGGSAGASLTADTKALPLTTYGSLKAQGLSVAALLALAGQDALTQQLSGVAGADLVFGFQGLSAAEIVETVNARGSLSLSQGRYSGLGLASAFNNDPAADYADAISLTAALDGLAKPVGIKGAARWRGETISLDATSDPGALLAGRAAATRASVSLSKASATFNGNVSPTLPASGMLSVKGKSLRALAEWLGSDLPPGSGYGAFDIKTAFSASEKKIALTNLAIALDDIKGAGNATVILGDKPDIDADFSFDLLDVNPYIAPPAKPGGTGTQSAAANAPSVWSREPIDFSFTKSATLALGARVNTMKVEGLNFGPLALKATMRGGKLAAELTEMRFYGGNGVAQVSIDTAEGTPRLAAKLAATGIQAFPFLRDAAKFERIEGGLDYTLDVTTAGNSEAAFVSALNGAMRFAFRDGAIRGINIARSMRALTSGALNGWNSVAAEKTDFSAFNASFAIKDGIATNSDLSLIGPLVRINGAGSVALPSQTLKYRVDPKIVPSLQGQGGTAELTGFAVPIIIEGPWASPRIYPDIKGFLQDPAAGIARLQALGGGFAKIASGKPGDLLGALGNDPKGGAAAKVGEALQQKSGIDLGTLVKDGKIDRKAGVAAAAGALGALLGGTQEAQPDTAPVATAENPPLRPGDIPIPRPKPGKAATSAPSAAAAINRAAKPNTEGNRKPTQTLPVQVPKEADKLIKGLGGLLGGSRN